MSFPDKLKVDRSQFDELRKTLAREGSLGFRVSTESMAPVIPVGAIIEVAQLDQRPVAPFDILVFWNGSELICHYVRQLNRLAPSGSVYVTSALGGVDLLPLPAEQILGRVVSHKLSLWRRVIILVNVLASRALSGRR